METSLLRASSLLPFGRARRLGPGRLPLVGLPGHDAVVLAGRRAGTGSGGVLAAVKAPVRDVKVACAKAGSEPDSMGNAEEFGKMYGIRSNKIERVLELMRLTDASVRVPLSEKEKAVQGKFMDIAERCIELHYDAMRRLPRAQRRRVDPTFWKVYLAFATVRSRATEGCATLEMGAMIADKLDVVRRMVSSACGAPLPLEMKEGAKLMTPDSSGWVFPVEGAEVVLFEIIENVYRTVKKDVDAMISGAPIA